MAKSVPAIFLDRDGTINVDHGYVHEIDNFEFIDGVIDAMRELKKMGFAGGPRCRSGWYLLLPASSAG